MSVSTKPGSAAPARPSARARILAAASDIARDVGPAHLSLDAVAARAGVSKGGLLYHFPAKLDLLEALVEDHIEQFTRDLSERQNRGPARRANTLLAFLDASMAEYEQKTPPAAGVLAAIVQHPEMLVPIRRFKRQMLDRLKAEAGDDPVALMLFVVLDGLRSMKLFDTEVLTPEETTAVLDTLRAMIDDAAGKAA